MLSSQVSCCAPLINSSMLMWPVGQKQLWSMAKVRVCSHPLVQTYYWNWIFRRTCLWGCFLCLSAFILKSLSFNVDGGSHSTDIWPDWGRRPRSISWHQGGSRYKLHFQQLSPVFPHLQTLANSKHQHDFVLTISITVDGLEYSLHNLINCKIWVCFCVCAFLYSIDALERKREGLLTTSSFTTV